MKFSCRLPKTIEAGGACPGFVPEPVQKTDSVMDNPFGGVRAAMARYGIEVPE